MESMNMVGMRSPITNDPEAWVDYGETSRDHVGQSNSTLRAHSSMWVCDKQYGVSSYRCDNFMMLHSFSK